MGKMPAFGFYKNRKGTQKFFVEKPKIKKPTDVMVKIIQTGVDGTDFSLIKFDKKDYAKKRNKMVLGHEVLGIVTKTGSKVKKLKKGDYVTATVRRGCGMCNPCNHGQSDMCMTGLYTERGIHKADGFLTKYFVDEEKWLLKIPKKYAKYGVFIEPLSIVEKGIQQIRHIQARMPWTCNHPQHNFSKDQWGKCKTALVIGAGPLGFLATILLRLANVTVFVLEIVPENHYKIKMIKKLGAFYINAKKNSPKQIFNKCCSATSLDIIFEASGASKIALSLIPYMSRSSIYVMTGIPHGEKVENLDADSILRQIVRHNIAIVGSVNSNIKHFKMALRDIPKINKKFNNILDEAITHRFPFNETKKAFQVKDEKQLKIVVDVNPEKGI